MIESIPCQILSLVHDMVWLDMMNNLDSLMDLHHVLHRFSFLPSNFIQGVNHCVILMHVVHAFKKLSYCQIRTSLQGMHLSTGISSQAVVDVWHHTLFLVLV